MTITPTLISVVSGSHLFVRHTPSLNGRGCFFFRIEEVKTCTFLTSRESSLSEETADTMFLLLKWAVTNKHCVGQIQEVVVWSAGGVPGV